MDCNMCQRRIGLWGWSGQRRCTNLEQKCAMPSAGGFSKRSSSSWCQKGGHSKGKLSEKKFCLPRPQRDNPVRQKVCKTDLLTSSWKIAHDSDLSQAFVHWSMERVEYLDEDARKCTFWTVSQKTCTTFATRRKSCKGPAIDACASRRCPARVNSMHLRVCLSYVWIFWFLKRDASSVEDVIGSDYEVSWNVGSSCQWGTRIHILEQTIWSGPQDVAWQEDLVI